MTNPLKNKNLVRGAWCVVAVSTALSCGPKKKSDEKPTPEPPPTAPLPTAGLAGQRVPIWPLGLVGAEDTLKWDWVTADRRATLDKCDSILATLLGARAPEVTWVYPTELRRIARRAAVLAPRHSSLLRRVSTIADSSASAWLRGSSTAPRWGGDVATAISTLIASRVMASGRGLGTSISSIKTMA